MGGAEAILLNKMERIPNRKDDAHGALSRFAPSHLLGGRGMFDLPLAKKRKSPRRVGMPCGAELVLAVVINDHGPARADERR